MTYDEMIKNINQNWKRMGEEKFEQPYRPESLELGGFHNGVAWVYDELKGIFGDDEKLKEAFKKIGIEGMENWE